MALVLWALSGTIGLALVAGGVAYIAVYAAVDSVVAPRDVRFVVDLIARRFGGRRTAAVVD
jgi:hypothetical protein